ncbi:MAG: sarcosine oxidase subunit gamma [Sulfitobacter sp.]
MHDLTAITALGASEPQIDRVAEMTLTEVPLLALASIAARLGQEKDCVAKLEKLLGGPVPKPDKAYLGDPFSAIWTGPDQWMIGANFETYETLADTVKTAVGKSGSVTEQTDAWACFDLMGPGIQAVMELLCNVNVRRMKTGDAQRTVLHHLGCFVICGDPNEFVRILGPRASAGSLHHALVTAMHAAA